MVPGTPPDGADEEMDFGEELKESGDKAGMQTASVADGRERFFTCTRSALEDENQGISIKHNNDGD